MRHVAGVTLALLLAACGSEGPKVLSLYPADGASGVPIDAKIEVTFDKPIRFVSDQNPLAVTLDGQPVEGEVAIAAGDTPLLVFTPRFFLLADRRYQAALGPGLAGDDGILVKAVHSWSFTAMAGCEMEPTAVAKDPASPVAPGGSIIVGGRRITPPGAQLDLGTFPTNAALSPDGRFLVVTNNGVGSHPGSVQSLTVIDTASGQIVQTVPYPDPKSLFYGLVFSPDGGRFYAAGGEADQVDVYTVGPDGTLATDSSIPVAGFPSGLAISPDGSLLYVAAQTASNEQVVAINLAQGNQRWHSQVGSLPYAIAVTPDGGRLFVSLWGRANIGDPGLVAILDAASGNLMTRVEVGKNPEGIAATSDGRVLVACSDADRVDVIDASSNTRTASWPVRADADPVGQSPVALAIDESRQRVYVACAQENSVEVLSLRDGTRLGSVPAGWYPDAIALGQRGDPLFIVNGKGHGIGPNTSGVHLSHLLIGTLTTTAAPTDDGLRQGARQVRDNNTYPLRFFPDRCLGKAFPVPRALGEHSPIKHVVFVLRENKTYDENLGDLDGTNGDPTLVMFGKDTTPNLHSLARQFCNLDNFYADIEVSVQGHYWNAAATINDYAEKVWHPSQRDSSRLPATSAEQVDYPAGGYIWAKLQDAGIDFRDYGEPMGVVGESQRYQKNINMEAMLDRATNLYLTPDATHVEWFMAEVDAGIFPPFVFLGLLNDHTYGGTPGQPDPVWMIAENDYATGLLVDKLSHSPHWPDTLVIVTEDDPQSGLDHVENHRSLALLISPYTRKGYTSSVHYDFSSLIRTYGLILGMPALTLLDENASPVYDCFSSKPDFTPYQALDNPVAYRVNPSNAPGARESLRMDFSAPDRAVGLGKVFWLRTHPGEPVPPALLDDDESDGNEQRPHQVLPVPLGPWPATKGSP